MRRLPLAPDISRRRLLLTASGAFLGSCHLRKASSPPLITFTRVPQANEGGQGEHDFITGRVTGGHAGQQIVLYAKSGRWWLQPLVDEPFTKIQADSQWVNSIHLGTDYAALLVDAGYLPPATVDELPPVGKMVAAVAIARGQKTSPSTVLQFSGYQWIVRDAPSNRGGTRNLYDPANAWTDASGALHLRMTNTSGHLTCAEVSLTRSLGYGTYVFSVADTSGLPPAAVFGIFTWDWARADQNYSELDIETSRWGDPTSKNTQYVVQPFYLPANVFRFSTGRGVITHSIQWQAGRLSFRSIRASGEAVAQHDFTSGVPTPGIESVRLNLYAFRGGKVPPDKSAEVVIEKFEYLP